MCVACVEGVLRKCEAQCDKVSIFIEIWKFQWLKSDARFDFQVELERASRMWFYTNSLLQYPPIWSKERPLVDLLPSE